MFGKLKPSVLTFLHSVFRTRMSSADIVPGVVPKHLDHIVTYCEKISAMKKADGIEQFKEWRVPEATAYKVKTGSRHEYISFPVFNVNTQETGHLIIERMLGDPLKVEMDMNAPPDDKPSKIQFRNPFSSSTSKEMDMNTKIAPGPSASSNHLSSSALNLLTSSFSSISSSYLSNPCLADDRIGPFPSKIRSSTDTNVCELHFQERKPLYLYHLAILALVVHKVNTEYLLRANNCYHFAGTIMKALEKEFEVVNVTESTEAGFWCGLDVYTRKEGNNILAIIEEFKQHIARFVSSFLQAYLSVTYTWDTGGVYFDEHGSQK